MYLGLRSAPGVILDVEEVRFLTDLHLHAFNLIERRLYFGWRPSRDANDLSVYGCFAVQEGHAAHPFRLRNAEIIEQSHGHIDELDIVFADASMSIFGEVYEERDAVKSCVFIAMIGRYDDDRVIQLTGFSQVIVDLLYASIEAENCILILTLIPRFIRFTG